MHVLSFFDNYLNLLPFAVILLMVLLVILGRKLHSREFKIRERGSPRKIAVETNKILLQVKKYCSWKY